ncbi:MAG: hypothetical protein FWC25_01810 [Dehalococcoidia bacterium]|nr:hypothetical protein [Dehalococcoidia bacterium]
MQRTRAYYRWQRMRTIRKKLSLLKCIGGDDLAQGWVRGKPGRLAKGKVHCSCYMCRAKSYDYISHQAAKQNESATQQMLGYVA